MPETKTEEIPATGHTKVIDEAVAPTCETPGKTEGSHCSVCGEVYQEQKEIPATGHSWDEGKITKYPTATEVGERTYTCKSCGSTRTEAMIKITVSVRQAIRARSAGSCIKTGNWYLKAMEQY